jgi:cell shape-determining protein MreC
MRNSFFPTLILVFLAAALAFFPDGTFQAWRLALRGSLVRLEKPSAPQFAPELSADERDLLDLLALKNAEIAGLRRRLADLGASREAIPNAAIIPARVIGLGPEDNLDSFTIDAGSEDGVTPGQAVAVGLNLVGVVAKSGSRASLVLSLASPGCYLTARLGGPESASDHPPQTLGAVRGAGGGRVRSILFSSESEAREGWLAVTSGLEKGVPAGLILGRLMERFSDGEESGTLEAGIAPGRDLASLDFVAVVMETP